MSETEGHPLTYEEALSVAASEARALPPTSTPSVCRYCFGPRDRQFTQCAGCRALVRNGASHEVLLRCVPLTIAPSPGAWWNRFSTYKTSTRDNMYFLAAALAHSVTHFAKEIEATLGGKPTVISIVPSKRGTPPNDQRLWQLLKLVAGAIPPMTPLVEFRTGEVLVRGVYDPDKFIGDRESISGQRVLIVEDAWISGSTAASTLGRVLDDGAANAMLLSITRRVETGAIATRPNIDASYLPRLDSRWTPSEALWPR